MNNNSKFYVSLLCIPILFTACKVAQQSSDPIITVKNTTNLSLSQKAVSIDKKQLKNYDTANAYPILIFKNDTIPAQFNDLNGDGKWDELFFTADFAPNEEKRIELRSSNTDPKFPIKTSVRFGKREAKDLPVHADTQEVLMANQVHKKLGYQKYQTDGPTWENDKVGFRHYLDEGIRKMFSEKNFRELHQRMSESIVKEL